MKLVIYVVFFFIFFIPNHSDAQLKDCEDNSSGKRFGFIESWDNCFGQLEVVDYFDSLSKFTDQKKPHLYEVDLEYTGEFKKGVPHGKGYATLILKKHNNDYGFYDGGLKNGLPHGKGNLYFAGELLEGTWKEGCVDWSKPTSYKTQYGHLQTKLINENVVLFENSIQSEDEVYPYEKVNAETCSWWVDKN